MGQGNNSLDLGTDLETSVSDLKFRIMCFWYLSKSEMYSIVRPFKALYVSTALFKLWRFGIDDHPNPLNISEECVL